MIFQAILELALGGGGKNRRTSIVTSNPGKPESKPESKPTPPADKPEPKPESKPSPKDDKNDLKTLPMPELMKKLGASADGLTQAEAVKRQAQYGPNQIEEKKTNEYLKFLSYFWGPIPWMIEAAVILSGIVRHWLDFFVILALLLSNALVGFWEEHQAGNAIAALKARLAVLAKVKRDGKWEDPKASELVPGDVIRLRLGDIVPADARLLDGDSIEVDQSALTGESLPVTAKPGGAVYSGSIIRQGEIDAIVYATGTNTYFGKTAQLVQSAHTVSHFQKAVMKIGDYLIVLAVALVALILAFALFRGDKVLTTLEFCLVLLVAAIPVAMPTVLSVTMAVGARLLAKKEAIVTRLSAIEELAGVDVLCSDKTGTLTQNKLTLGDPFTVDGIAPDKVILWAALASRAEDKDTIDLAVIGGVKDDKQLKSCKVLHFIPFDPVHKRTEATVKGADGKQFFVAKGAPQVILKMATNVGEVKAAVEKAILDFAGKGFRSLGVARADEEGKWKFVGMLPLFDPPRVQAKATIASAIQMGVKIKMVTGDQIAIARETSKQLGLGSNILDASSLGDLKKDATPEQAKAIEGADGFAQVFPEHKFHIIEVLQKHGHIVGMTGDGVNDAPALKKADCGIAVSGATDAARAAASIVLLASGLSVIIDAIKESRRIFQRMNSYAIYRIAETLRVLFFMTLAILVFNFYPVTAVMIVMIALLNDGAILSIAYDNVLYRNKPEAWNMRLVLSISTVLGVIGVVAAFGLFYLAERVFHLDRLHAQTLMYLKLSVAGHLTIFLTRTRGPFWSIRPAKILMIAVVGTQTIATLIAVYGVFMTPLGWKWAGFVWGYAIVWALINDRIKLLAYKIFDPVKAAPKSDGKAEQKPDAKTEPKPDTKADEPTPEAKPDESKPGVKVDAPSPAPKAEQPKPDAKADATTPEAKGEPKPEEKAGPTPEAKADEPKPEAKTEPKSEAKTPSDLTPQIAKRAYELYGERAGNDGTAVQDWKKAEQEIRNDESKADQPKPEAKADAPAPEAKAKPKPEEKAAQTPEAKGEPKHEAKAEPEPKAEADAPAPEAKADQPKPEAKADSPAPEVKAEPKPVAKADEPKPEAKDKTQPDVTPQLVKRVHELYEQLGREDVQNVQDWEKAEPELQKTEPDK
jgi:H+-transporting ATPase